MTNKLTELRAQHESLFKSMEVILETTETENRDATGAESKEFDRIMKEYDALGEKIVNLEKFDKAKTDRETPVRTIQPENTVITPDGHVRSGARIVRPGAKYDQVFNLRSVNSGGWKNFNELLTCVAEGQSDRRLFDVEQRFMTTMEGTAAGFLVPSQFSSEIYNLALEESVCFKACRVYPMTSKTLDIPSWDNEDHSDGAVYGGWTASWTKEGATNTELDPAVRLLSLTAKNLNLFTTATRELMNDSINFEAQLTEALKNAVAWELDYNLINGDGVAKPLGGAQFEFHN